MPNDTQTINLTKKDILLIRYALSMARVHAQESARISQSPSDRLLNEKAADAFSDIEKSISGQVSRH